MWLNPEEISKWAYYYCLNIKDRPEIRKFITNSIDAYYYCFNIEDRPEVRKYITDTFWAFCYCMDIKNDPEVRKYIIESELDPPLQGILTFSLEQI